MKTSKKKLKLNELQIKSFITDLDMTKLRGGIETGYVHCNSVDGANTGCESSNDPL